MSIRAFLCCFLVLAPCLSASADDPYDRLTTLVGSWQGAFTWSGARSGDGELDVEYYLTGAGSALVENHVSADGPYMTSVYHLDGEDLRLTHFCAARNQPRMKASEIAADGSRIRFDLIDITNLAATSSSHTRRIEIEFLDPDHVDLWLTVREGERESVEHLKLTRHH